MIAQAAVVFEPFLFQQFGYVCMCMTEPVIAVIFTVFILLVSDYKTCQ